MLFNKNIEEIIFNRHQMFPCDELVIISGYVGSVPIKRLSKLPFPSTVVYGMYGSQGISSKLDSTIKNIVSENNLTTVLYSDTPVHSKCYLWKKNGQIVHALVGSANFSTNGLTTDFRETLAETTYDTFAPLQEYYTEIIENSFSCTEYEPNEEIESSVDAADTSSLTCDMVLYDPVTNEVQPKGGLNWGHGDGHNSRDVSYVPIRVKHITQHPSIFKPKLKKPVKTKGGKVTRQNETLEFIWDDGTIMQGLFEGSQPVNGEKYPKQLSSYPEKSIIGKYIRKRLGLPEGSKVTMADLKQYGRDYITIKLIDEGTLYIDFSPINKEED